MPGSPTTPESVVSLLSVVFGPMHLVFMIQKMFRKPKDRSGRIENSDLTTWHLFAADHTLPRHRKGFGVIEDFKL
jgi:hypothetical protein